MTRTTVVYLGGAGRSGTTFVSLLLSQNHDCFDIGQIRDLPDGIAKKHVCSCGKPLVTCDFWGEVAARLVAGYGIHALSRFKEGLEAFSKGAELIGDWSVRLDLAALAADHAAFLDLTAGLYRICREVAGTRALIDSSKTPGLGLALALAGEVDLYMLNLVRDPRAVCASWSKLNKNPAKLEGHQRAWNRRLARMGQFEALMPDAFRRIRYEDFATSPLPMVQAIQSWAGLEENTGFFTAPNAANVSWDRTHLFPPVNEEVLKHKADHITIRPSESWKAPANRPYVELAERVNFPQAETVGYSLLAGAETP